MIVDSMTFEEIFNLYKKDLLFVNHRKEECKKNFNKRIKNFSNNTERYYFEPVIFKTPQGFEYVSQYFKRANDEEASLGKLGAIDYATFVKKEGRFAIIFSLINRKFYITHFFIPHFFERYRERLLKDSSLKMTDVIYKYFMNNLKSIDMKKEFPSKKHPNEYWKACQDGLCLCETPEVGLVINKTFVSWEMARKDQKDFAIEGKEFIEDLFPNIWDNDFLF